MLYLGAASGSSVSHVSDVVGPEGVVYAVEFSHRSGRDLIGMAKKRTNVIPIVEDARHPQKYRMLVQMVDVIFADVAQPDQARIIALNAHHFLKNGGAIVISIKANCIDSTAPAAQVFASEVNIMRKEGIKPKGALNESRIVSIAADPQSNSPWSRTSEITPSSLESTSDTPPKSAPVWALAEEAVSFAFTYTLDHLFWLRFRFALFQYTTMCTSINVPMTRRDVAWSS